MRLVPGVCALGDLERAHGLFVFEREFVSCVWRVKLMMVMMMMMMMAMSRIQRLASGARCMDGWFAPGAGQLSGGVLCV